MKTDFTATKNTLADAVTPSATTVQTMSSRQIAELTKKNHRDVVRDIKVMCEKMGWGMHKFAHTHVNPQNKQTYTEYHLPFYESMTLITGYDVKRRAKVVRRWMDLEFGQAEPLVSKPEPVEPFQAEPKDSIDSKYKL